MLIFNLVSRSAHKYQTNKTILKFSHYSQIPDKQNYISGITLYTHTRQTKLYLRSHTKHTYQTNKTIFKVSHYAQIPDKQNYLQEVGGIMKL